MHTVIVVDAEGRPIRVSCDYCHSEHNFRGGPRLDVSRPSSIADLTRRQAQGHREPRQGVTGSAPQSSAPQRPAKSAPSTLHNPSAEGFPLVSERERIAPAMSLHDNSTEDLELLLRRIIREEAGITPVTPAAKWRGGTLVLRPGTPGLQEKTFPIETFFHKVVMLRNRLRTLEQQVNASALPDDVKVKLQGYVSGCYGSLTSFNILFAEEDDQFKGSGGD
jgi:hypothetical protein